MINTQEKIQELLVQADICLNGDRPWDLTVHDNRFYDRVIRHGSIGLGEAYMDGWWDAEELDEFFCKLLRAELDKKAGYSPGWILLFLRSLFTNLQRQTKAYQIGERHYDIGNDLYRAMLDKRMVYTGAYWEDASTLDEAQENKLEMVCRKLGLQPGQSVLDIGCGWGSFAKYAAEKYDVEVIGITVSKEQAKLGRELCEGLPVTIRLQDYRDLDEQFEHIVSLGMIEHVGYKNYRKYFDVVTRCLSDSGSVLLQSIGSSYAVRVTDPWIQKYIFPNSMLPSISQLANAFEGKLVVEDWQNIGVDYDRTLMAWFRNFNKNWSSLSHNYSERFYRMWKYYLLMSAGGFRARKNQLWQIAFTKSGLPNGFRVPGYRESEVAYLSKQG
ncbi:cyclopropane fatty acyl phospholipid synthase [Rhodohalobacter sp. 8-1]|uniref:cyclopropane fatty acyl phospholipid synthase n=1 Tax=Rhodohalobacter sp. 8-1 TaxID=3131972 RepID=UPI0030EBC83E